MLYTSGTTGKPKGVPRSHRADRAAGLSQVIQHGLNDGDRTLGAMPLYHTMGMHSLLAMSLAGGCFVVQERWDAAQALELIEREQLTALYLAPTLYHDLVTHPDVRRHDLSSVRALAYAGVACCARSSRLEHLVLRPADRAQIAAGRNSPFAGRSSSLRIRFISCCWSSLS